MARRLEVEIVGDARSLNRALGSAETSTKGLSSKMGNLGKVAVATAGAAGIGALFATIRAGIGEYKEHTQVVAQTNAVLKSTGHAAGITAKHVGDLATSIMEKTGIDDEAIQSNENLLLGFTNLRNEMGKGNDIFDRTTRLIQDYSVRTGKSAAQASIIFGKALNDPIKGLGGLSRAGVILTDKQKDLIKSWVEHGDKLKAQRYLLGLLEDRYKGAAEAAGKTLPGQINIAKETFKNFAGDLVARAIPAIETTIMWLRDHWPEISAGIKRFWSDVKPILDSTISLITAIANIFIKNWPAIKPIVVAVGKQIESVMKVVHSALKLVADLLQGRWGQAWKDLKGIVGNALNAIVAQIRVYGAVGGLIWKAMRNLATNAVQGVLGGLEGIGSKAWNLINNIGAVIAEKAGAAVTWGEGIGHRLVSGIVSGLAGLGGRIVALIKSAVNAVIDKINSVLSFHVTIDTHIPGVGKKSFGYDSHIPHLASGGSLSAGQLAVVGEKGPELFMPNTSGTVIPNGGGRGGPIYLITPDGKALAEFVFDGMRGAAQVYKQRTGRQAFA